MTDRRRNLLHFTRLFAWKQFAQREGWAEIETVGDYEVCRFERGEVVAIVWRRDRAKEHYTVQGASLKITEDFLLDVERNAT